MSTTRKGRPERPADHGPGTDGPVWSEREGRWILPLNERGRAVVAGFLDKYPEAESCLCGRSLLWLYNRAARVFDAEEIRSLVLDAVVKAARSYRPDWGGVDPEAYTYVVNGVKNDVLRATQSAELARARLPCVGDPYTDEGERFLDSHPAPAEAEGEPDGPGEDHIGTHWAAFNDKERAVLVGVYRCGRNLAEVGKLLGVTRSRAGQIHATAVQRLRALVLSRETPETPGDKTTRRIVWPPKNAQAAVR
jgi:DNA-directed RNA polymerase specialized sigma24 family protein